MPRLLLSTLHCLGDAEAREQSSTVNYRRIAGNGHRNKNSCHHMHLLHQPDRDKVKDQDKDEDRRQRRRDGPKTKTKELKTEEVGRRGRRKDEGAGVEQKWIKGRRLKPNALKKDTPLQQMLWKALKGTRNYTGNLTYDHSRERSTS